MDPRIIVCVCVCGRCCVEEQHKQSVLSGSLNNAPFYPEASRVPLHEMKYNFRLPLK